MDWFQRINIVALSALMLVTTAMLVQHEISVRRSAIHAIDSTERLKRHYSDIQADNARIFAGVLSRQKAGQYETAMKKLREIMQSHGDSAYAHVLMARLSYTQGHLADAIHAYRLAVEKDPDYVDKNTPLFIGKEIMDIITESRGKLNREKKLKPGDMKIRTAVNDIYYLQRRIAGGCE